MTDQPEEFAILRVEFSEEELARIEAAAEADSVSEEWLRVQLLRVVRQEPQKDE